MQTPCRVIHASGTPVCGRSPSVCLPPFRSLSGFKGFLIRLVPHRFLVQHRPRYFLTRPQNLNAPRTVRGGWLPRGFSLISNANILSGTSLPGLPCVSPQYNSLIAWETKNSMVARRFGRRSLPRHSNATEYCSMTNRREEMLTAVTAFPYSSPMLEMGSHSVLPT